MAREPREQPPVRVDLGRHGRDPDGGQIVQLGHEIEIRRDGEGRLRAQGVWADERPFEMHAQHFCAIRCGFRHGLADAGEAGPQCRFGRRHGGCEQGRRAMLPMEPGHGANRVRPFHHVGTAAAMHVEIDEARHDQPLGGDPRIRLDRCDLMGEVEPAPDDTLFGDDPPLDGRTLGHATPPGPRRISATKS